MNLVLDGGVIRSKQDFHTALRIAARPPSYGGDLDAMWRLLLGLAGPVRIVWHRAEDSHAAMGEDFERIVAVIHAAASQFPDGDFRFELRQ